MRNTAQVFCIGMSIQMGRMSQWTRDKLTAFYTRLTEFFGQARQLLSDLGSICKDPSTAFSVFKELFFGTVVNALDVGTDINSAYQLLTVSQ